MWRTKSQSAILHLYCVNIIIRCRGKIDNYARRATAKSDPGPGTLSETLSPVWCNYAAYERWYTCPLCWTRVTGVTRLIITMGSCCKERNINVWLGTKFKKEHIQYLDIKTWRVFIVKYVYLDFTKVRKPPALIRLMMIIYPSNDKESPHDPGCPIIHIIVLFLLRGHNIISATSAE